MKVVRYGAASLMILSGILHVTSPLFLTLNTAALVAVMVGFGIAYLVIGGGLFSGRGRAYLAGIVLPIAGLLTGPLLFSRDAISFTILLLGAIDVVVVASCIRLMRQNRQKRSP